ncbi:hypothetical protein [Sediminibacillus albus]|uniref:Uncharacterized protein n=1 Tax=Sediminibacillus albus TaxID=407036 RepID=A0A1G8WPC2_9BACI|nr:hypothetical protein [Sediminibacillus albus]SDJ80124.1 hypothetical protein SAMN05216243_0920 [Sediminibacillus albus]
MKRSNLIIPILIGVLTFASALVLFWVIDSPSPYLAALVVAFLIFEISFYHLLSSLCMKKNPFTERWKSR